MGQKTFDIKIFYSGYITKRVQADNQDEAWTEFMKERLTEKNFNNFYDEHAEDRNWFMDTLKRLPEADEIEEVEPDSPIDEDRVIFDGPTGWPDQGIELDRMIEREG